nr:immunoglobulin light chain junction region [Macaca mulatta]
DYYCMSWFNNVSVF